MDIQLKTPFTMLVAASSNSGKTRLVRDILVNHNITMDRAIDEICWLHHKNARDETMFADIKKEVNIPIRFIEGYPDDRVSSSTLFDAGSRLKCLVIDDIVQSAIRFPSFMELFTVISHHESIIVIAIVQNLYADTPAQRQLINNLIRNCSYLVLFPDRRSLAVCRQVANTYFTGEQHRLLQPFKSLMSPAAENKYQYMVIDFINKDDNLQVRFNGLRPDEECFYFTFSSPLNSINSKTEHARTQS